MSTATSQSKFESQKESMGYFVAAFCFLLLGLILLIFQSEKLAAGGFSSSAVIGSLHFITLGWLTTSIFGALRVFSNVALGSAGLGARSNLIIFCSWIAGVILFPIGLIINTPVMILTGLVFLTIGLFLETIHVSIILIHAQRGKLTRGFLILAFISLWSAWVIGVGAGSVRAGFFLFSLKENFLSAHILLAAFGWVGATVVGVGTHLLPMFALSKGAPLWAVKAALPIWIAIVVFGILGAFVDSSFTSIGWVAAFVGSVLWIMQVFMFMFYRARREYDAGLALTSVATITMGGAWVFYYFTQQGLTFIGMVIISWLSLFTFGIYHRVIPFLVWIDRFKNQAGLGTVTKVRELTSRRLATGTILISFSGAIAWNVGLFLGNQMTLLIGSSLLVVGALSFLLQAPILFKKKEQAQ